MANAEREEISNKKLQRRYPNLYRCFTTDAQIIIEGDLKYIVNSFTDFIPLPSSKLTREATRILASALDYNDCDLLVGEVDGAGYLVTLVADAVEKPFKRFWNEPRGLEEFGEVGFRFEMAYNQNMGLYFIPPEPGSNVIIVEDMVDSGGTMIAMIKLLRQCGSEVIDAVALTERTDKNGVEKIKEETGIVVKTLIKLDPSGDKCRIVNS